MVTTDDPAMADWHPRRPAARHDRDAWRRYLPGGSWRYAVAEAGLKANMTDVQAASVGRSCASSPDLAAAPPHIAGRYDEALAGVPGLELRAGPSEDVTPGTCT